MPVKRRVEFTLGADRLDRVYCGCCGVDNPLKLTDDFRAVAPCAACGKEMLDPLELFVLLGVSSAEHVRCPRCSHPIISSRFCYLCGEKQ